MIRLVKSEEVDAVLVVPKGMEAEQDVEKTLHLDVPSCIRKVLNEFKDVFPIDLPRRVASSVKMPRIWH